MQGSIVPIATVALDLDRQFAEQAERDETAPMIIVQGSFRIAPEDREQFLAESVELQRISRGEQGCLEYVFAADPLEPDRTILSERWERRADLDAHLEAMAARRSAAAETGEQRVAPLSREVSFFEASEISLSL